MKKDRFAPPRREHWNRENRFTGWTDVDLSEKGVAEAVKAGRLLRKEGFLFGRAYTYLKRAVKTLGVVLDRMDRDWMPVSKTWRLNEKHTACFRDSTKTRRPKNTATSRCTSGAAVTTWPPAPLRRTIPQPALRSPLPHGYPKPRCPAPSR